MTIKESIGTGAAIVFVIGAYLIYPHFVKASNHEISMLISCATSFNDQDFTKKYLKLITSEATEYEIKSAKKQCRNERETKYRNLILSAKTQSA